MTHDCLSPPVTTRNSYRSLGHWGLHSLMDLKVKVHLNRLRPKTEMSRPPIEPMSDFGFDLDRLY